MKSPDKIACSGYMISAGKLKKHIEYIKVSFAKEYEERKERQSDYIHRLYTVDESTGECFNLNYNQLAKKRNNEDMNFNSSFPKAAFAVIPNAEMVFSTFTLSSRFHPFGKNENLNVKTIYDYERMVYKGFTTLSNFSRNLYKQTLFKELTNKKRARIDAFEPHQNSLVAHLHKMEIIDGDYLNEYINALIHQHSLSSLGRTEITIFRRSFEKVAHTFELYKKDENVYGLVDNEDIYFKVMDANGLDEAMAIAYYLTDYLESLDDEDDEDKQKNKKSAAFYNSWALYIAHLKNKFECKEDNKPFKKIRRVRFSKLLINRQIYRRIFNRELKAMLESGGDYTKHSMYFTITKLLHQQDLKIGLSYGKTDSGEKRIDALKVNYDDKTMVLDLRKRSLYRQDYMNDDDVILMQAKKDDETYEFEPYLPAHLYDFS